MNLRYPYYYQLFKCTAGACTDSCCMHWEIDIDDKSLEKYTKWPGEFGERLRDSIYINEEGGHFKMNSERCVFLNSDGLCDMILNIGEENLCNICREHPRFYDCFDSFEEVGVGLCCEAAARLILDERISDEIIDPLPSPDNNLSEVDLSLFQERASLLNSSFQSIEENEILDSSWADAFYRKETIEELTELLLSFEIISPLWRTMIIDLRSNIEQVLSNKKEFIRLHPEVIIHEHRLMKYFIYRYFMSARFYEDIDSAIEAKIQFTFISIGIITLLDIIFWIKNDDFTLNDQINICKLYSQEIEYDEDNVCELENYFFSI